MRVRVLEDFVGRWRLTRKIIAAAAPEARFEGQAVFTPCANGLAYHEQGRLLLPGQPAMQSERRYVWQVGLNVHFEDGRFFHQVPATGGDAEHWCDPDRYFVAYSFDAWPEWRSEWQVKGPRKDYVMVSDYRASTPLA